MFKLAIKAAEGDSRRRFLRRHKRRAKMTSTSIAKHPKTIPAIAGPDNLASNDELDVSAVWTLGSFSEAPPPSVDLGVVSWLAIVSGRRSYCELSRYFITRTKSNSKGLFSNMSTCIVC